MLAHGTILPLWFVIELVTNSVAAQIVRSRRIVTPSKFSSLLVFFMGVCAKGI